MSRFAEAINASAGSATIPGRPPGINIVYVVFLFDDSSYRSSSALANRSIRNSPIS
jgi:hypothetical protein